MCSELGSIWSNSRVAQVTFYLMSLHVVVWVERSSCRAGLATVECLCFAAISIDKVPNKFPAWNRVPRCTSPALNPLWTSKLQNILNSLPRSLAFTHIQKPGRHRPADLTGKQQVSGLATQFWARVDLCYHTCDTATMRWLLLWILNEFW